MEAINKRLQELEKTETDLYFQRQSTIQRRQRDDAEIRARRQEEDGVFFAQLTARDHEEDAIRRDRRVLARSFLSNAKSVKDLELKLASGTTAWKGKTGAQRAVGNHDAQQRKKKEAGLPTARDSQGRALFTRPSDGKLVYLRCCVQGCERTTFDTVLSLRRHVSEPLYRHKMKGMFNSNSHAVEVCGETAPGQGEANFNGDLARETHIESMGLLIKSMPSFESEVQDHLGWEGLGSNPGHTIASFENPFDVATADMAVGKSRCTYRVASTLHCNESRSKETNLPKTAGLNRDIPILKHEGNDCFLSAGFPSIDRISRSGAVKKVVGRRKQVVSGDTAYLNAEEKRTDTSKQAITCSTIKEEHAKTSLLLEQSNSGCRDFVQTSAAVPNVRIQSSIKIHNNTRNSRRGRKRPASYPPSTPPAQKYSNRVNEPLTI